MVETPTGITVNLPASCPVCNSNSLSEFLFRKQVPIHQNLLMHDQASAIAAPRGDLALAVCEACGFIFNRAFDPTRPMYGEEYENTQGCSPSFNQYMNDLVEEMVVNRNVRDSHVVEVGCGNGLFLRKLVSYEGAGNRGSGFDPSYRGNESEFDGRLQFVTRYYDFESAGVPADVVVCRHVIEHVPRPLDLLHNIKKALAHARGARVFFETPCVEWILRNQVIWDFFYEHCSYFSKSSLTTAFEVAGFEVKSVTHVFAGQYLWLEATLPRLTPAGARPAEGIATLAKVFARAEEDLMHAWKKKIQSLAQAGKVALWGAGAKGVTFANMIDSDRRWIDSIVDLNPSKQGHFVPGTGHPIISHRDLITRGVTSVVLMNPNYFEENLALLKAIKGDIQLVEKL